MYYKISHITEYLYDSDVSVCYNLACLTPRSTHQQTCHHSHTQIAPQPSVYKQRVDYFGNQVSFFCIQSPHNQLIVETISEIEISPSPGIELYNSPDWEKVRQELQQITTDKTLMAKEYCFDSALVNVNQSLHDYAAKFFTKNKPILVAVNELMQNIYTDFTYDPHFTTITTPLTEVLAHRRGVCQDFAHLAIGCIRSVGLAARYVSGYLETLPPPGQPRLVGADASHAWFAVFVPDLGWIEFDPTNNRIPEEQHIVVAYGRDFADVTPLKGVVFGGGKHQLNVSVDVAPLTTTTKQTQHVPAT